MLRLTRAQLREIDRRSIEEYHIPGIVLMENAARAVAQTAHEMIADASTSRILLLCGGGNNGGDGLAVARHLHNHGLPVTIFLTIDPAKYSGDALVNWNIVRSMKIPRLEAFDEVMRRDFTLVIDAIFGTGLTAPSRPPAEGVIQYLNFDSQNILAVDLPSGLDCDTGKPLGACVRATRTVTFVAEKAGFANPASKRYTGEIIVGEIGCPRELIEEVSQSTITNQQQ